MSTQKGNHKKQAQRHQNAFKFKNNNLAGKNAKAQEAPLDLLCRRCLDQIKWKIDFGKYKPLSKPHKCNKCQGPWVFKAYRTICDKCATQEKSNGILLCTKCGENVKAKEESGYAESGRMTAKEEKKEEEVLDETARLLEGLKLRQSKAIRRKI